jgi:hypothetical protein
MIVPVCDDLGMQDMTPPQHLGYHSATAHEEQEPPLMTYPPQQPGPYGQDPSGRQPPGQYGQFGQPPGGQAGQFGPGPYGRQPGGPGGEPPKRRTGLVIAVVVVAVLVLGVGGYLLTDGDDPQDCASGGSTGCTQEPAARDEPAPGGEGPVSPAEPTEEPAGGNGAGVSEDELQEIAQSYVDAVNAQDEQAAMQHRCVASGPGALYETDDGTGTISVGDVRMLSETFAHVDIFFGDPANGNRMPLPLTVQDGSWCVQY